MVLHKLRKYFLIESNLQSKQIAMKMSKIDYFKQNISIGKNQNQKKKNGSLSTKPSKHTTTTAENQ